MRKWCVLLLLMATIAVGATAPQSVGLVLSGGGAKGIAHIGVIQALEDNDIPIDYIAGTSMGAIVGGLYAAGYTPQEMMDLLLSEGFGYWSTGTINPDLKYYFSEEYESPTMLSIPIESKGDSARNARNAVPASLISPMPMSFAFMDLFSAYTAQCDGDFNRLFVPFRCVASDVDAKRKVVMRSGSLGNAIRSSMSFPVVFQPTRVDSMLLYDGGIYDNFPIDVMRDDFAPSIMIGVNVAKGSGAPGTSLFDQLENLVIQRNDFVMPPEEGIRININLQEFGLLDFPKARRIYQIGYDHGMAMIDSIKSRIHTRISPETRNLRRAIFKSQTPYVRFSKIDVTGGTPRQNQYIRYLFTGGHPNDTIGMVKARRSYYRAISSGKFRDLHPQSAYNDSTGMFALQLRAAVKDNFAVGFGGWVTSSTSSYIYVSAGYSTLSFSSVAANVGLWVGQNYLGARLDARLNMQTAVPSAIEVQAVASRHNLNRREELFYEDFSSYLANHEYFGRLQLALAAGSHGKVDLGTGYGWIYDAGDWEGEANMKISAAQAYARFTFNTLDRINFPTSGHSFNIAAMGVWARQHIFGLSAVDYHDSPGWFQIESRARNYFNCSRRFTLGIESDVMLSTRPLVKQSYDAAVIAAPSFRPTSATYNWFNPGFRAYSFVGVGVIPVYKFSASLSMRLGGYAFLPMQKIESRLNPETGINEAHFCKKWFSHPEYFTEMAVVYGFPFGTLSGYVNYASAGYSRWNGGISFGVFIQAPRFLR